MTVAGAGKSQKCHMYISQYSKFAPERFQVRTWGRQTCFLPRVPFNFVTPLCGIRAFLFCHNVWPLCYVTIPQFCHNVWWCWRNTPDLLHISLLGKWLCWCSFAVCEGIGRKIEVQETVKKLLIFSKQFLRPRQSGAHGTCHACHTLDTPLAAITRVIRNYSWLGKLQYFRRRPNEVTYSSNWEEANHLYWHDISVLPTYWQRVSRQRRFIEYLLCEQH